MTFFYERLAKRIQDGTHGLTGHGATFETERCALDLREALKALGIASVVVPAGKQFKVRLSNLSGTETGTHPLGQPAEDVHSPQEVPSPAPPQPVLASLPAKEKRRRFVELAKDEHVETASEFTEGQAQLELSFSPVRKAAKRRKKP